jgi:NADPH:quinone reductase-like Zn-dependent oxidoreductase
MSTPRFTNLSLLYSNLLFNMPLNHGAWLTTPGAPLIIESAPILDPEPHQILIRSRAVAVNPVDWAMQMMGPERFPFLKCPCILGQDVAGEVVALGSAVTRIQVGDRVLGLAGGPQANDQGQLGAFQECTLLADNMCSPIPASIPFEEACAESSGAQICGPGLSV